MDIYGLDDERNANMEQCWNGTDRGKLEYSERNSAIDTLSIEGPT
jgi:hypothetical protein